jgi:CRISPR-associated endonuclease Csn1
VKRIPLVEVKVEDVVDPVVKQVIANAITKYGSIKAAIEAEQENNDGSIWLNKEKNVKLKTVRCFQDHASGAASIRALRDTSAKEYKRFHYSRPDGNYVAAIYEGTDKKGNKKRSFVLVTNLDAAKAFNTHQQIVPETSEEGYALLCTIKKGDLVLLYENSPEELRSATQAELNKRLYKIVKMSDSGGLQITIRHHQEAREATKLKELYGNSKTGLFESSQEIYPQRRLSHNQFNALVQGQHFELTETGKITIR